MVNLMLQRQRLIPMWKLNAPESSANVDAPDHQVKSFLIETVDTKYVFRKALRFTLLPLTAILTSSKH